MLKNFTATILLFGILIFATATNAEVLTFTGIGVHYIEDSNETLDAAKNKAKLAAELNAMEQAHINVKGYSESHNLNLTNDEIITITAGVLKVTAVKYALKSESDGVLLMQAEVTAEIDVDKIPEFIEREMKRHKN